MAVVIILEGFRPASRRLPAPAGCRSIHSSGMTAATLQRVPYVSYPGGAAKEGCPRRRASRLAETPAASGLTTPIPTTATRRGKFPSPCLSKGPPLPCGSRRLASPSLIAPIARHFYALILSLARQRNFVHAHSVFFRATILSIRVCALVVATVIALGMAVTPADASWNLRKVNGREYVTLDNISDFYGFQSRSVSGKRAILRTGQRSLIVEAGSKELYINGIKFLLSYPTVGQDGDILVSRMDLSKLIEPVLRPSRIKGAGGFRTVILDPGHGGHDSGAVGAWGREKDYTLDVALRARNLLSRSGYRVEMTRSTDVFIPLEKRAAFANQFKDAIFVSIHFNSSENKAASGIETFVLSPRGVPSFAQDGPRVSDYQLCRGNARDAENIALATAMHASILRRLKMPDRGIKRARYLVIREVEIPGVLLEGGFLSCLRDSRMVASSNYRQQMANGIVDAIHNYRKAISAPAPDSLPVIRTVRNANGPTVVTSPN